MAWMDNFSDLMNKTASVYSRTVTPDRYGGFTYTDSLRASVKGALWMKSAAEQFLSQKVSNVSSWVFACKPNNNFAEDDKVIIDSVTYKVTKPDDVLFEGDIMLIGLEVVE